MRSGEGLRAFCAWLAALSIGAAFSQTVNPPKHQHVWLVIVLYAVGVLAGLAWAVLYVKVVLRRRLGGRCIQLSNEILEFIGERKSEDPILELMGRSGTEAHDEYARRAPAFSQRTLDTYDRRFSARALALYDELVERGYGGMQPRSNIEHPTNPLGMREVALKLGAHGYRLKGRDN